jgi:hypothetical protein
MCVCVCPILILNAWTKFYETRYVYHATWAHISSLIKNPSNQSVCLYVYFPFITRQRLGSVKIPVELLGNGSVETL